MLRRIAVIFTAFALFFTSCMPAVEKDILPETPPDPFIDIAGDWASPFKQLYLMHGVTATFSDDLTDQEKRIWLLYLEESVNLLPPHLLREIEGLLFSFNSGNTCVEDRNLACFTRHNFSVFMSTTKQEKKRNNIKTMLHEIGHAVDYKMTGNEPTMPDKLHKNRNKPTPYARTNAYEDFAETFSIYILSPGYLLTKSPARYDFMRDKIFQGKEYFNK